MFREERRLRSPLYSGQRNCFPPETQFWKTLFLRLPCYKPRLAYLEGFLVSNLVLVYVAFFNVVRSTVQKCVCVQHVAQH